jgi:hypothetical protein
VSYFLAASLRCQASSVAGVTGTTAGRALGWRGLVQAGWTAECGWRAAGYTGLLGGWKPS